MDPNACLAEIARLFDSGSDDERLHELCDALKSWIQRGGFEPDWSKHYNGLRTIVFAKREASK
jgi:hypothetical protein